MNDEIKEILESSRKIIKSNRKNGFDRIIMLGDDIDKLLDYITNLQKENEKLKFWLNDVIFDDNNNDVELPARYLKKLGYIDFDDEKQVYINRHNNEPFFQEDYKEKAFYLKDDELDDYTKQLEYKFKKAIEYIKENGYIDLNGYDLLEILGGDE